MTAPLGQSLTPREVEVLRARAKFDTNKDVARMLDISPQTVKNHLTTIYAKLGVESAGDAFLVVGWLKPPNGNGAHVHVWGQFTLTVCMSCLRVRSDD